MAFISRTRDAVLGLYSRANSLVLASKPKAASIVGSERIANEVTVAVPFGQNRGKQPEYDARLFMDEGYRRNVVAHACISVIAAAASEPEIKVVQQGDDHVEVGLEHPLAKLMRQPNPMESMKEFLERILIDINAAGYAYIHKGRNSGGQVIRLQRLRPDHVFPIPGDNIGEVLGYEFRPGNGARDQMINENDIIRIGLPDPLDDHAGLSPLMVAAPFINIHQQASKYLQDYFLNGAVPAGFVVIKSGPIDPQERQRVMGDFADTYGNGSSGSRDRGNFHRWGVIGGDVDFKQLSTDIDKLDLDSIWGTTESNICSAFRVPAVLVQAKIGLQRNTYSSHNEARRSLWEDSLPPHFNRIKFAFQRSLIEAETDEPLEIVIDVSKVAALQESEDLRIERANKKFAGGIITRNEARMLAGDRKLPEDYIVIITGAIKVDDDGKAIEAKPPEPGTITTDGKLVPHIPPVPGSPEDIALKEQAIESAQKMFAVSGRKKPAAKADDAVEEVVHSEKDKAETHRAGEDREALRASTFRPTEAAGDAERHGAAPEDPRVQEIARRLEDAWLASQAAVDVSALEAAIEAKDFKAINAAISAAGAENTYAAALSEVISRVIEQTGLVEYPQVSPIVPRFSIRGGALDDASGKATQPATVSSNPNGASGRDRHNDTAFFQFSRASDTSSRKTERSTLALPIPQGDAFYDAVASPRHDGEGSISAYRDFDSGTLAGNMFVSQQQSIHEDASESVDREAHGEAANHPFRGNQWTGGFGSSPLSWDIGAMTDREKFQAVDSAVKYVAHAKTLHEVHVNMHLEGTKVSLGSAAIVEAQIHASILGMPKLAREMMEKDGWKVEIAGRIDDDDEGSSVTLGFTDLDAKTVALSESAVVGRPQWEDLPGYTKDGLPYVGQPLLQHELGHVEVFAMQRNALAAMEAGDTESANEIAGAMKELADAVMDNRAKNIPALSKYSGRFSNSLNAWTKMSAPSAIIDAKGNIKRTLSVPDFLHETYAELRSAIEGQSFDGPATMGTAAFSVKQRPYERHVQAYRRIRKVLGDLGKKAKKWSSAQFDGAHGAPNLVDVLGKVSFQ